MSNLPAWKNVISGGLLPNGSPLYYYSPAPSFNGGGGGSGSVAYADTAGTALTASYVNIKGSGITVNYFGSQIQLTGSGGSGSNSESASYASTASYALYAVSASYEIIQELSSSYAESASQSTSASYASTASFVNILGNKIIVNNYPNGIQLTGSDSVATASYVQLNYGPGIISDPVIPMAFSASLRSVNGVFPTNGNVATSLAGVETGTSQSLYLSSSGDITASINEGAVWVISNDPTSSNNGKSFIYDVDDAGIGSWYELSSTDLATTDARYLKLDGANSPLQGNVNLGGFDLTNGDLIGTSSWAITSSNAVSASYAATSSQAISASYVNITGSNIIVNYSGSQIQLTGSGDATVIISGSIPGEKKAGSLWFNSNDGNTYIQYIDPTGSTWIPAATSVGNAFSSSYATNALSASRAQTASVAASASIAASASVSMFAVTASYALTVAPKSGFLWVSSMGDPSIVGGAMFGTATFLSANPGIRITQNVGGQYGGVNFNAVGFDFNKDFRISIATYAGVAGGGGVTGDGVWIGFGGSIPVDRQANNSQGFTWWSSTFATNAGQWIYYNGTALYWDNAETSTTGRWVANTIESRRNTVGARTISVFTDGIYRAGVAGNQTLGGSWITVGASTGAAWADHYVRYICFEYI